MIAIAAALTFLGLNSFFHLTIATNDVGSLKVLTTGSGFDIDPNPVSNANFTTLSSALTLILLLQAPAFRINSIDQFDQCVKQKDADLDGKLGLSDFASCYSQVFANKSDP